MKSFDQWTQEMADSGKPHHSDWSFWFDRGEVRVDPKYPKSFCVSCRSCEHNYPISDYIGADEFDPEDPYLLCGRSDRCIP